MFKIIILKIKLKYYTFNYNRFYTWGIESPYYKKKVNETKKEISKTKRRIAYFTAM